MGSFFLHPSLGFLNPKQHRIQTDWWFLRLYWAAFEQTANSVWTHKPDHLKQKRLIWALLSKIKWYLQYKGWSTNEFSLINYNKVILIKQIININHQLNVVNSGMQSTVYLTFRLINNLNKLPKEVTALTYMSHEHEDASHGSSLQCRVGSTCSNYSLLSYFYVLVIFMLRPLWSVSQFKSFAQYLHKAGMVSVIALKIFLMYFCSFRNILKCF